MVLAGRFRLGPLLGRGGMAEVYDGYDERLRRPVAVKLVRPQAAARAGVLRRFEEEARNAARLVHPNVVAVFDTGSDGGTPFLVMERLPGTTLADRLASGPLALPEARRLTLEVLAALGAAHRAGIVHRDVKPANVLLDEHGHAKVADFGIAKSLDVDIDLTSTGQVVGTPAYVAPERLAGERATPAADLYAAGLLLYEMLAGAKAFPGDDPLAVAYRVRNESPPRLTDVRPDVPPPLLRSVERAIDKDPARRFASAEEMAAVVAATEAVGAPAGGDVTVAVPLPDVATAVLPAAATPGAAGTTNVGGQLLGLPRPIGPEVPRARTARQRWRTIGRPRLGGVLAVAVVLLVIAIVAGMALTSGGSSGTVAGDLRSTAASLAAADGPAAAIAAASLRDLAASVEAGDAGPAATELLRDLAVWRDRAALTPSAVDRIRTVVARVPGADPSAFTSLTAEATTTTTAAATSSPAAPGVKGGKGHRKGPENDD